MKERLLKFLKEDGLTVFIVVALIVAYAVLSTRGDDFGSMADLESELANGQPTVVQFYSNRCSICLVSKPKVDQMERDLAEEAEVLRLNIKDDPGRALAQRWGVVGVPTFFVLDGSGEAVYARAGAPDTEGIMEAVRGTSE